MRTGSSVAIPSGTERSSFSAENSSPSSIINSSSGGSVTSLTTSTPMASRLSSTFS